MVGIKVVHKKPRDHNAQKAAIVLLHWKRNIVFLLHCSVHTKGPVLLIYKCFFINKKENSNQHLNMKMQICQLIASDLPSTFSL
ncbi:hypothetical protein GDO86_001107 [Hymenochirus boettgeri]|uniref:Uncharacterized protein n=1 Tax=Hymenochirus boettgeri TaxID=247094 RepID=A0A8T2KEJ8_9PIPI|nr:hypothetical protein GDO86_001107 [Hymenochirus boettgeri]